MAPGFQPRGAFAHRLRVLCNRALWQADQQIITPTIYHGNYLAALKAASNGNSPAPLVRTLDFAQLFSLAVDWTSFARAEADLKQAKAFMDSTEADERGIRLRLP